MASPHLMHKTCGFRGGGISIRYIMYYKKRAGTINDALGSQVTLGLTAGHETIGDSERG